MLFSPKRHSQHSGLAVFSPPPSHTRIKIEIILRNTLQCASAPDLRRAATVTPLKSQAFSRAADDVLGDAWQHRYHRRICWQSLCVHFGGAEQSSASITGWELAKWLPVADYTADPKLPDAELEDTGIRLGSTWVELQAAYPDVVAGGAEGNTLAVDDTPWGGIFDGVATWRLSGQWNYERPTDAPADATVTRLSAGDGPEPGCC